MKTFLGNQLGDTPSPPKTTKRSTVFSAHLIDAKELKFKTYSQQNQKIKTLYFFLGAFLGRASWLSCADRPAAAFGAAFGWALDFGTLSRFCGGTFFCLGKIGLAEGCSKRYYMGRYVESTDQNSTVENGGLSKISRPHPTLKGKRRYCPWRPYCLNRVSQKGKLKQESGDSTLSWLLQTARPDSLQT